MITGIERRRQEFLKRPGCFEFGGYFVFLSFARPGTWVVREVDVEYRTYNPVSAVDGHFADALRAMQAISAHSRQPKTPTT